MEYGANKQAMGVRATNAPIKITKDTIKTFIKQAWPVLAFYIIGDIATTIWALENGGYEANPFLSSAMEMYGYSALLLAKAFIVAFMFTFFVLSLKDGKWHKLNWNIARGVFTVAGVVLVANNLIAISTLLQV